jgi:hypothetical protein
MIMIILSGNYPRHYNAIMLELPDLTLEELFKVLDNIVEVPQFNLGQTTIRRDASNWNPYDSGTFISSASK